MFADRYGLPLSTYAPAAADAYIEGVDRILGLEAGADVSLLRALEYDPDFALAHVALALHRQTQADAAGARAAIDLALELAPDLTPREQSQVEAVEHAVAGDPIQETIGAMEAHVGQYPRDFLLLQQCVNLINRSGERDRKQRAIGLIERYWAQYNADWGFDALYAMALQENDRFDEARHLGERSLAANPRNALAIHPLSHVAYETNEHAAGAEVLGRWLTDYDWSAPYHCHLAWHQALFYLNLGHDSDALQVFERDIAPVEQARTLLPDAASLLWRLDVYGMTPETLDWQSVRRHAEAAANRPAQSFEVAHVALYAAATNDDALFDKLIDGLRETDRKGHPIAGDVILPLVQGMRAFAGEDYAEASRLLESIAPFEMIVGGSPAIGGSNTQREVFADTLIVAYLRSGRVEAAEAALRARLDRRESARDRDWLAQARRLTTRP